MEKIRSESCFKEKPRNTVARTHPPCAPKTLPGLRYHNATVHKGPQEVEFSCREWEVDNIIPSLHGG